MTIVTAICSSNYEQCESNGQLIVCLLRCHLLEVSTAAEWIWLKTWELLELKTQKNKIEESKVSKKKPQLSYVCLCNIYWWFVLIQNERNLSGKKPLLFLKHQSLTSTSDCSLFQRNENNVEAQRPFQSTAWSNSFLYEKSFLCWPATDYRNIILQESRDQ